ncbi:MAG TPA: hypothetical protein VI685_23080 [Candidatus Angelobacter sp.]
MILLLGLKARLLYWPSVIPTRAKVETQAQAINIDQPHADLIRENANLARQLEDLRNRVNELAADLKAKRQALDSAEADKLQVSTRGAELERAKADLTQKLVARDSLNAQLTSELTRTKGHVEQLESAKASGEIQVETARSELNALHEEITALTEELNERRQLSAAAEQAKELIVARHLHIVDVDDTDGNGRRQRPFGRIFYTEGRKLVFYAYDLADSHKINAKINFYVWGGREGINSPVRRLGIFHADDESEGRWVLRFDDPSVLTQINCVFVTAESTKKPATEPTGHQILFASLGPKPNHP